MHEHFILSPLIKKDISLTLQTIHPPFSENRFIEEGWAFEGYLYGASNDIKRLTHGERVAGFRELHHKLASIESNNIQLEQTSTTDGVSVHAGVLSHGVEAHLATTGKWTLFPCNKLLCQAFDCPSVSVLRRVYCPPFDC